MWSCNYSKPRHLWLLACLASFSAVPSEGFGLESGLSGTSWHYQISVAAAQRAGFGDNATHLVAWKTDAIDRYLYDPLVNVHNFMKPLWDAAHFDNLFSVQDVANQWKRYVYGAFYGLVYAAEQNDHIAAFNVLGTASHAIQDFFSHSTWMSDNRRRLKTPFDFTEAEFLSMNTPPQDATSLWTGAYPADKTRPAGILLHGGQVTPLNSWKLSKPGWIPTRGINLDRTANASTALKNRRMNYRIETSAFFSEAVDTAARATLQLYQKLGEYMHKAGKGAFWESLKNYTPPSRPVLDTTLGASGKFPWQHSLFDKRNPQGPQKVPWEFVVGGAYAGGPGWYLRVGFTTRDGTDGDMSVKVGDHPPIVLDHDNYNDYERGNADAYFIGPYARFSSITVALKNKGVNPAWQGGVHIVGFYVGFQEPAYVHLVKDNDVKLDNSSKTWSVSSTGLRFFFTAFGKMADVGRVRVFSHIEIKTGSPVGAGTDSNIDLTVVGDAGEATVRLNPLLVGNAFEKGNVDRCMAFLKPVGNIKEIRLRTDAMYAASDWYCDYVVVDGKRFEVNSWINKKGKWYGFAASVPAINYSIAVKTGNKSGAGTDSNITLTVIGTKGSWSETLNPHMRGNAFERNQTDACVLPRADVGTITEIRLRSDTKYSGSAWFCEYVLINGRRFNVNRWFENTGTYPFR